jgi:hypothetical protein
MISVAVALLCLLGQAGPVDADPATHFELITPGSVLLSTDFAGPGFLFTLRVLDASNNLATDYFAFMVYTTTDPAGSVPHQGFVSGNVIVEGAALRTVGVHTITAADNGGLTGTSNNIVAHGYDRDFNGDLLGDILWRDTSGDLSLWIMAGAATAAKLDLGNVATDWTVAGVGDFDSNGTSDILWRESSGLATIWRMDNG